MSDLSTKTYYKRLDALAMLLSAVAIVSSSLHFWPFHENKIWQFLCPANLAVLLWVVTCAVCFGPISSCFKTSGTPDTSIHLGLLNSLKIFRRRYPTEKPHFPHLSVVAYLSVSVLSMAMAPNLARSASFNAKLALMLVGAYTLFSCAISNTRQLRRAYALATLALATTVTCCLVDQFWGHKTFGLFKNAHKYGSYIGMLTPLCITFLLLGPGRWTKLLALALIVGSVISAGTLGAVAATIFGLLVALIVTSTWAGRVSILGTLLIAAAVVLVIRTNWPVVSWPDDIVLTEKDGKNLRQRYVEWQAELNLLEQRAVVGTGAGCLNEYRSEFYYRLPKLNTLQAFDQNGWLATAAETGILGLVCFSWILLSYCQQVYHHLKEAESDALSADLAPTCAASLAGLAGACVTNIFSSVMYNGVLIVFVLLLVLAAKSGELSRKP